jgi:hypothetical protein
MYMGQITWPIPEENKNKTVKLGPNNGILHVNVANVNIIPDSIKSLFF